MEFKFNNSSSTEIEFSYKTIDAALRTSSAKVYEHTFSSVTTRTLAGNIFNDNDGLVDNTVDGTGIDDPGTEQLYATLYDNNNSEVLQPIAVGSDGSFTFSNLTSYDDYGVLISTNQGTIGSGLPTIALPTDWVLTGDFQGTAAGNDGTVDGNQPGLSVVPANLANVNFGINKTPTADAYSFGISNPAPDSYFTIGSGSTADLSGTDLEDGTIGDGDDFAITSLPTENNTLYYNSVQITLGDDGSNPPSPANPFTIRNFDASLLEVRFSGNASQTNTSFNYISIDAADFGSAPTTYTLSYSALPVEWISFDATKVGDAAVLRFATASELNNSHFLIQKSTDGRNFYEIGTLAGQGNSSFVNQYGFTDPVLNIGLNYYRIVQVDYNGKMDFTDVKSVTYDQKNLTSVFPNPISVFENSLNVKYFSEEENVIIRINSMLGSDIRSFEITNPIGWNQTRIALEGLPVGAYALRIGDKGKAIIFTVQE